MMALRAAVELSANAPEAGIAAKVRTAAATTTAARIFLCIVDCSFDSGRQTVVCGRGKHTPLIDPGRWRPHHIRSGTGPPINGGAITTPVRHQRRTRSRGGL